MLKAPQSCRKSVSKQGGKSSKKRGSIQYVELRINSPCELFGLQFLSLCGRVHALSGFVDTAVGMHDGVLDEVDAGSGGIMELKAGGRDGGISQEDTGGAW